MIGGYLNAVPMGLNQYYKLQSQAPLGLMMKTTLTPWDLNTIYPKTPLDLNTISPKTPLDMNRKTTKTPLDLSTSFPIANS